MGFLVFLVPFHRLSHLRLRLMTASAQMFLLPSWFRWTEAKARPCFENIHCIFVFSQIMTLFQNYSLHLHHLTNHDGSGGQRQSSKINFHHLTNDDDNEADLHLKKRFSDSGRQISRASGESRVDVTEPTVVLIWIFLISIDIIQPWLKTRSNLIFQSSHLRLVDRPTQLICISDIYLLSRDK